MIFVGKFIMSICDDGVVFTYLKENRHWIFPERNRTRCLFHTIRWSLIAQCGKYSITQEICTRFLLCCGYTLTDLPISIRLTSLALWQSNDCPSASKATLMNMDKYLMWINYERLHNHNKAKHNKTVCIFLRIYCNIKETCPPVSFI